MLEVQWYVPQAQAQNVQASAIEGTCNQESSVKEYQYWRVALATYIAFQVSQFLSVIIKAQAALAVGAGVITCQDLRFTQGIFQLVIVILLKLRNIYIINICQSCFHIH